MSNINVTILDVEVADVPEKNYKTATVSFKDSEGKVDARKIMSFINKPVFDFFSTFNVPENKGVWWNIEREKSKDGKYWNWMAVHRQDGVPQVAATPTPKSTYETSDERSLRQKYIIAQSCLAQSIAYCATATDIDEVLDTAEVFMKWVLSKGA